MCDFILHQRLDEDCHIIGDLPLCRLLLMNDSNYPWLILVPRRNNLREIYQLEEMDRQQLLAESCELSEVIMHQFKGHKLNVAALGNMVPQLHIHHIVRFEHDPAWPGPVWGKVKARPYTESETADIHGQLNAQLPLKPAQ